MKTFPAVVAALLVIAGPLPADSNEPASEPAQRSSASAAEADVEREYRKLLEEDDAAQEEIDRWILQEQAFAEAGAGLSGSALRHRIDHRLNRVRRNYESFLERHPGHARARLAYGSFLNELGEELEAAREWEKARELDPANPAAWNNLANYYGHRGPVKKAFGYYEKAIELDPGEPVYYWNFATTVYLFRKDAREHYDIVEQEVFDKALGLYQKAIELDPTNFILASDYAQSYYGTNPPRWEEGRVAWEKAMKIARDDIERQGVHIHLARIKIRLKLFDEAREHLEAVRDQMYDRLKTTISRNLDNAIAEARQDQAL